MYRDKTMDDKVIYVLNNDKQNYPNFVDYLDDNLGKYFL